MLCFDVQIIKAWVFAIQFLDWRVLDKPTEVRLGIYINSFYSINEQTMVCNLVCNFVSQCN
jgi:hypothetical protein